MRKLSKAFVAITLGTLGSALGPKYDAFIRDTANRPVHILRAVTRMPRNFIWFSGSDVLLLQRSDTRQDLGVY